VFTNEFEFDETIITVLDDNGVYEDVQIYLDDNEVYIRQWNERKKSHDLIVMSAKMMLEIMEAMKRPEGAYIIK
jgi:DNA/RNA-binding domain of Phe-tRNA-synthetase-like protein